MFSNIILLFIFLFILLIVLTYTKKVKDSFFDFPDPSHRAFVDKSKKKLNPLTNMINLTNPAISVNNITQNDMDRALGGFKYIEGFGTLEPTVKFKTPDEIPDALRQASICQKSGPVCSAFDDANFSTNCGVSFDVNSIGSDGKPHMGGLYLSPNDRERQIISAKNVRETGSAPYDSYKVYKPTLGSAKAGTFGISKDSCIVVKEKVDCLSKQTFSSPNCTQCYTSQDFARVGPDTARLPCIIYINGNGSVSITTTNNLITLNETTFDPAAPIQVNIPSNSEGTTFYIKIRAAANPPTYISGYIQGETPRGTFKLDIMYLVQSDTVTNSKPRMNGTKAINGFRCFSLIPGTGKTSMNLSCLIPFSFLNMYDGDALTCDNGPVITQSASATFLESDPCYGKANQPGNYKLECLQTRWIELGGTPEGTGYPTNKATSDKIQRSANGAALTIDTIVDNLSEIMIKALTGKTRSGTMLSIPEWNEASMYATGVPINTPCDGPGGMPPLSQQCLSYLYMNRGSGSRIGGTYTAPASELGHGKGQIENFEDYPQKKKLTMDGLHEEFSNPNSYNYLGTSLDPNTPSGLETGQQLGSIAAVKQKYDQVNRLANDNSKSNEERATFIQQAYGVNLGSATAKKKDFDVRIPAYKPTKTYNDMKSECESKGQRLCDSTEICDMASRSVINPELTSNFPGDNWIAVGDTQNEWLTLNRGDNRYCKTHKEVAGYLPAWGSNRDPSGWERLAKCCGGETTAQGRYIRLQYDRVECLNLAQIAIYANDQESSNYVTPSTPITKSSGFGGDVFPVDNIKNGYGNTFTHTSCGDVPWLLVDLGAIVPVYKVVITNRGDCCQHRVVGTTIILLNESRTPVCQSNPIKTINRTYTWFPPSKSIYVDLTGEKPSPGYKHNGCWEDKEDRAVPTMEYTDPRLDGASYWGRADAITKCYNVAKDRGMKVFALQHNGWCAGSTDPNGFKRYGPSGACYGEGKGGPWANDVYTIGDEAGDKAALDRRQAFGDNGSATCERYCSGVGGGSWNNELPADWNGAKCVGVSPNISDCYSNFGSGGVCTCEKTGTGWRQGGWLSS